ncbi:MAG: folate-binding protein [Betaproteobacteria bacterium]|nr:folate-binding protein [Betaproteobacteria bacterium]
MNNWTNYLAQEGARIDSDSSSLSINFGAPHADVDALARNAVAVPLLHLGLIRATGEEAGAFLHRLLSNDVAGLTADAVQWTSFNTAQGRMLANFLLWRDSDDLCLALSSDLTSSLLKKLSFYILRAKVKLSLPEQERALIGLAGPMAGAHLSRAAMPVPEADMRQRVSTDRRTIRLGENLFILDLPAFEAPAAFDALRQSGIPASGTASWQLAAIRAGLPLVTAATQEAFVAQMLNFELIGGVSFTKGCYPGQEIVARMQHLGKPKRRMFRIGLLSPTTGANIPVGTALYGSTPQSANAPGAIVNFAPLPEGGEALAVIRTEFVRAGEEIHIGAPEGPCVEVLELPYEVPEVT